MMTPVEDHFPKKHMDVLEQVIYHKMPSDKFDEVATFDGSHARNFESSLSNQS